ncbi:MAG: tetratricopeptide repeat protein [SAR324 cluster bacterium]|nr:tetratricopeptide repeat protein [SAR324 cluster bacterium]
MKLVKITFLVTTGLIFISAFYVPEINAYKLPPVKCQGDCRNGRGIGYFESGFKYEGYWEEGRPDGEGIFYHKNGSVLYKGQYRNGKFDGQGIYYSKDGSRYEGQFKNGKRNGQGIKFFSKHGNEKIYEGQWQKNKYSGQGIHFDIVFGGGYQGQFQNGKYHGQGFLFKKDGSRYFEGQFKNGEKQGQGTLYWRNGSIEYEGQWEKGDKQGQGTSYWPDGSKEYEGQWQKNKYDGLGTLYSENGSITKKGVFKKGEFTGQLSPGCHGDCLNGQGQLVSKKGFIIYEGQWVNGKRHGHGTSFFHENPEIKEYEGQWKAGKFDGQGIYSYIYGGKYQGQFQNGQHHGQGILYSSDGSKYYEGQWENGEIHGQGTQYAKDGSVVYEGQWENSRWVCDTPLVFYLGEYQQELATGPLKFSLGVTTCEPKALDYLKSHLEDVQSEIKKIHTIKLQEIASSFGQKKLKQNILARLDFIFPETVEWEDPKPLKKILLLGLKVPEKPRLPDPFTSNKGQIDQVWDSISKKMETEKRAAEALKESDTKAKRSYLAWIHHDMAIHYLKLFQLTEQRDSFQLALQYASSANGLAPDNAVFWRLLGTLNLMDKKNPESGIQAKEALLRAIEMDPNDVESRLVLTDIWWWSQNYEMVLLHLEFLFKNFPAQLSENNLNRMTVAYINAGLTDRGIRLYQGFLDQYPDESRVRAAQSMLLGGQDKNRVAIKVRRSQTEAQLVKNIDKNPTEENYNALARIRFQKAVSLMKDWRKRKDPGLFQQALTNIVSATDLNPKMGDYWFFQGMIYSELKSSKEAMESAAQSFIEAIAANPAHKKAQFMLAYTLSEQGRYWSAIEQFEYLIEQYPDMINGQVMVPLALSYIADGRVEAGISYFSTLQKSYSDKPSVAISLAVLKKYNNKLEEASKILNGVLEQVSSSEQTRRSVKSLLAQWEKEGEK